jgi:hypothetical protein
MNNSTRLNSNSVLAGGSGQISRGRRHRPLGFASSVAPNVRLLEEFRTVNSQASDTYAYAYDNLSEYYEDEDDHTPPFQHESSTSREPYGTRMAFWAQSNGDGGNIPSSMFSAKTSLDPINVDAALVEAQVEDERSKESLRQACQVHIHAHSALLLELTIYP